MKNTLFATSVLVAIIMVQTNVAHAQYGGGGGGAPGSFGTMFNNPALSNNGSSAYVAPFAGTVLGASTVKTNGLVPVTVVREGTGGGTIFTKPVVKKPTGKKVVMAPKTTGAKKINYVKKVVMVPVTKWVPADEVVTTGAGSCRYIRYYNSLAGTSSDLGKLKTFLNTYEGASLDVKTGTFGASEDAAVKAFQAKYGIAVTGKQFVATTAKINEIWCKAEAEKAKKTN